MTWKQALKSIIIPPNKGDISVRCGVALPSDMSIEYDDSSEKGSSITEKDKTFAQKYFGFLNHPQTNPEQSKTSGDYQNIENNDDSILNAIIGYVVDITGTIYMLSFVMILLIAWIIWGAVTGAPDTWQIVMQDGQSIQTYVWDTFLMRQQLDDNEKFLIVIAKLESRFQTHLRLINKLQTEYPNQTFNSTTFDQAKEIEQIEIETTDSAPKNWFDKLSELVSESVGSLYSFIIYWIGIFAWIGCGALPTNNGTKQDPDMQTFSNEWQMYINTTTAIILLFTSVFLEHVRYRESQLISKKTQLFTKIDMELEEYLRSLTSDYEENEMAVIHRFPRDKLQKVILFYANVIGNGLGLIISTCVFIVWFGIGNLMHWNSNWWLVIGTYTGLVGFIDGFVLREIFHSLTSYERSELNRLLEESQKLLDLSDIPLELKTYKKRLNLTARISIFINKVCSNKWSVVASCVVVIGLVAMACGLLWSETAQLICNTPTMIIEGFLLLVLIQAHNWASAERDFTIGELITSRKMVYKYYHQRFSGVNEINKETFEKSLYECEIGE